jgi:hypothetical protein
MFSLVISSPDELSYQITSFFNARHHHINTSLSQQHFFHEVTKEQGEWGREREREREKKKEPIFIL